MKVWKLAFFLALVNLVLFAVGLGRGQPGPGGEGRPRVGVVLDVGGRGDKSFNDAAYAGLMRAKRELGIGAKFVEPGDGSDRESALRLLAWADFDLVIGVGFIFSDDMRRLAVEFPGVKFACIDYVPGADSPANLVGLRFREHEGAFLVGSLAGLVTRTGAVGFVGGMQIPLIRKFETGYTAGVKYVCPGCKVHSAYAGTEPKAFADPTTGQELALAQYDRGADIVFHASGKTGIGVFNAASLRKRFAIGVDADQFHEAPCCVLTSMVKGVDVAVFETIRAVKEGRFQGGIRELGLAEGGVDYIYDGNNRSWIPDAVRTKVEEVRQAIVAGTIRVPQE